MTSTAPAKSGILSYLFGEELHNTLVAAGMTEGLRRAIIADHQVARAAVRAAEDRVQANLQEDEARQRRETMVIRLADTKLFTTRVRNLLMRRGIVTIGDLCMWTVSSLDDIHRMGSKGVLEIMQVLAVNGLDLLDERGNALRHAINLYGNAEYVPSKLMPMWTSGINSRTKDILAKYETLGDLSTLSGREFMHDEYQVSDQYISVAKNQLLHVRDGLRKAGLTFRSE